MPSYLIGFLVFLSAFFIFYSLLEKGKFFSRLINSLVAFIAAIYISYIITVYSADLSLLLSLSFLFFLLVFFFALLWKGFKRKK